MRAVRGRLARDYARLAFLHGGVAASVATRDAENRPSTARGWGPLVAEDGWSLTLCVVAPPGSATRANLGGAESAAAVPLLVHGGLVGLLYLESERPGAFGPGDERLLRILGRQLAAALALQQTDRREAGGPLGAPTAPPRGEAISVTYYQADDSVFVGEDYVMKGVPGRILWRLLREHAAAGRTTFTNRELRLDESLGLPVGNDNLEARLLVLRKRLASSAPWRSTRSRPRGRCARHTSGDRAKRLLSSR